MLRGLRPFAFDVRAKAGPEADDQARALRLVRAFEENGSGWFWETDAEGRLTYLSPSVEKTLKSIGIDAAGQILNDIFELDPNAANISRTLAFHVGAHTAFTDFPVRTMKDKCAIRWAISGRPNLDAKGEFQGFVGSGSDLTERHRAQADITRLAFMDGLTGLANRQRMKSSLDQLLSTRSSGFNPTALLLLDLDRFKSVNDTLGHQTGDELLKQVSQRLQRVVGEAGLVGRLGGDEFKVIVAKNSVRETVVDLANAIIGSLSQPYFINDSPISIGCSIGIAIAPEHGGDSETLVRNADLALYSAKDAGRGVHRLYSSDLIEAARRRKELEDDLRHALANGQLHVAYQAVVSTKESRIVGYEALVRWEHPVHGAISPADFIPIAEECGLIESIGEWVLRSAVRDATQWPETIRVAVNVSPVQFANPKLASIVANALASSGLTPDRLELEITEGVFLNEDASSEQMFKMLKKLGVRLALDDFGTGYSSLGYLKNAPFDKIKIDQSFVRGAITSGSRNGAIIKAIVALASALGMETTAEGVEQQDEIGFIRDLGCSHIQGFVYGKAMRIETVLANLQSHGDAAPISGHKVSRLPRTKVFRSARMRIGDTSNEICIRDLSPRGAMIEGVRSSANIIGMDVLIELLEGQMLAGNVRWVENGKAGLEFKTELDSGFLQT